MTKSESSSTLRKGLLAIAYIFLLLNLFKIFLDWNSTIHDLIGFVVLVIGSSIILTVSGKNNIFGAISYVLLLVYVYGFEAAVHNTGLILRLSPVILLVVAWLVGY